jgi:hypothetical protein
MSIQRLQSHWGFIRMPFGRIRDLLKDCYPAATAAFADLDGGLATAPTRRRRPS